MAPSRTPRRAALDPRLTALAEESGYEILGRIGAGGMGIVFRAHDADGNDVAIKLLRHEIADDPRARERLGREVAAQKLVRNDNIVRILDAELDSPEAFVVTEFIPGPTLEDAVRERGGLHPEAVREIGLVLGETLQDIHRAGVIHRDLKPSNVMLRGATEADLAGFDPDGDRLDPVIIDFGIAIAAEESRLTSTGLVMGTAAYLDPEVGRTDHVGERGDWWAWAALLSFAATGREPFGTGRADVVLLRAERGEIDVEGVPTEFAQWLRAALRSAPEQRPEPAELLERLAALDLTRYEDPGRTELIDAGSRTAVLTGTGAADGAAVPGAAGADAAEPGAAERDADGPEAGGRWSAQGPTDGAAQRTEALAPTSTPAEQPTEALPRVTTPQEQVTAALPRVATPAEPVTEALPRVTTPAEPVTEALPVLGTPTRALPVVPPQHHPAPHSPMPPSPAPHGAHGVPPGPAPQDPYGQRFDPRDPHRQRAAAQPAPPRAPEPQPAYGGPAFAEPADPRVRAQQAMEADRPWTAGPGAAPGDQAAGHAPWPAPPPRRPLLVWLGHLLLVALAGLAPYVSVAMLLLLGALARTWERSHRAVTAQRWRGATGAGPSWRAGLAAPFRFLVGLVETALQAVLPLLLGVLVGIAVDAAWTLLRGSPPPDGLAFALAMAVTLLITWVGLGSATTRNGAHRMLDAAAPDLLWGGVVVVLLLLLLGSVVVTLLARDGMVDYFPFPGGPRLADIAVWRR